MKKTLRNSFISFFLIISILTPSIVLAFVAADTLPPVPVSDAGLRQKSLGLITVFGITIPGISLDGLMIAFARAEVDKITNSTVNWINSGFHGSPQFMQDPIGDLGNIANGLTGNVIQSIGLGALCSPFQLNVRVALRNSLINQRRPGDNYTTQCTFTGTVQNLQNFVNGNFAQGGWQGWFEMTQVPTNNPYGSFLDAKATIQSDQARQLEIATMQANWGQGFLSYDKCTTGPNGGQTCITKTPGSVINGQLEKVLGSEVDQLNLTNDFNQIMTALLGQLVKRVFSSAQGLLTGNPNGGYGGGGGGGSATGACYPNIQIVYLNTAPATPVTWSASIVGVTNPLFSWAGTGGLTGNTTNSNPITYSSAGTKTASVTVSGVNSSGQTTSQTIQCTPNVTVNQFGPISGVCTVAPTAAPVYQLSNTPPSAANNVTFTLTPSGGSGIYRAFTWDGVDPSVKVPGGGFPNPIQTITYFPRTTASSTFTRIYDKTGSKNVGVTIIDANPTVVPVTVQCDQVFIF